MIPNSKSNIYKINSFPSSRKRTTNMIEIPFAMDNYLAINLTITMFWQCSMALSVSYDSKWFYLVPNSYKLHSKWIPDMASNQPTYARIWAHFPKFGAAAYIFLWLAGCTRSTSTATPSSRRSSFSTVTPLTSRVRQGGPNPRWPADSSAVLQYFVSPILVAHGFFPLLLSNLLYTAALSYYSYLNFLGYDGEPASTLGRSPSRVSASCAYYRLNLF